MDAPPLWKNGSIPLRLCVILLDVENCGSHRGSQHIHEIVRPGGEPSDCSLSNRAVRQIAEMSCLSEGLDSVSICRECFFTKFAQYLLLGLFRYFLRCVLTDGAAYEREKQTYLSLGHFSVNRDPGGSARRW